MRSWQSILPLVLYVTTCSGLFIGCAGLGGAHDGPGHEADRSGKELKRRPSDADRARAAALVAEGVRRRDLGELQDAQALFDRALALDGGLAAAHLEWALTGETVGSPAVDIQMHYREAARLRPDDGRTVALAGAWFDRRGDLAEAILLYDRAVELDPMGSDAWTRRGDVLLRMGKLEEAQTSFLRAHELDAASLPALMGIAFVAEQRRDFVAAEDALRAVVALHPDVTIHRTRLIGFLKRTGQEADARAETRVLERLAPKDPRKLRALPGSQRK